AAERGGWSGERVAKPRRAQRRIELRRERARVFPVEHSAFLAIEIEGDVRFVIATRGFSGQREAAALERSDAVPAIVVSAHGRRGRRRFRAVEARDACAELRAAGFECRRKAAVARAMR